MLSFLFTFKERYPKYLDGVSTAGLKKLLEELKSVKELVAKIDSHCDAIHNETQIRALPQQAPLPQQVQQQQQPMPVNYNARPGYGNAPTNYPGVPNSIPMQQGQQGQQQQGQGQGQMFPLQQQAQQPTSFPGPNYR